MFDAEFKNSVIMCVEDIEELPDAAIVLARQPPLKREITIMSNVGGPAILSYPRISLM